jgi:hypothetical protein
VHLNVCTGQVDLVALSTLKYTFADNAFDKEEMKLGVHEVSGCAHTPPTHGLSRLLRLAVTLEC